jgi:hypothetical protein
MDEDLFLSHGLHREKQLRVFRNYRERTSSRRTQHLPSRLAPSCSRHPCCGGGQYLGCDRRALVFEMGFSILNRTFSKWDAENADVRGFLGCFLRVFGARPRPIKVLYGSKFSEDYSSSVKIREISGRECSP